MSMTVKSARANTGGLSDPSKMPGLSTSTPAQHCITGSKLVNVPGSACFNCYALKNNYTRWPGVRPALENRFELLDHPQWVESMALLINRSKEPWFRWHDSGDLQSLEHLRRIFEVCHLTPGVKHWLPTRETQFVKQISESEVPKNLVIRLSSHMIDQGPVKFWPWTSTISSKGSHTCPAPAQDNECQDCRKCWSKRVKTVSYKLH
jgi:hypothetical protein